MQVNATAEYASANFWAMYSSQDPFSTLLVQLVIKYYWSTLLKGRLKWFSSRRLADFFSPASFGLIHIEMTDAACSTLSSMRIRTSEFHEAAQEIDREISLDGTPANFSIPLTNLLPSTSYEASLQFSRNDCFSGKSEHGLHNCDVRGRSMRLHLLIPI